MKVLLLFALQFLLLANLHAEAPNLLTYQGRLKEGGLAVSGNRLVKILLCNDEFAGSCENSGEQSVTVSNGLFRSTFTVPSAANFGSGNWWLEIWVAGAQLTPRERLTSNAYSLFSATAAYAENIAAATGSLGVYISSNLYVTGGGKYYGDGSQLSGISASVVPAAGVQPGTLGATVIASSIAINSVEDASIISLSASKLTGILPAIDGSALTNLPVSGGAVAKIGDTMTGTLAINAASALTTGNQPALVVSTNVYTVGYSSAARYYGDGSALTGISATTIADGAVTDAKIVTMSSSKLIGTVSPALVDLSTVAVSIAQKADLAAAAFIGAISASNLSGTNTGDQTNITGNAATASALAANAANCAAGNFPLGVDAAGGAESCVDAATQGELDTHDSLTNTHGATSSNVASRIVMRDASGDFSAGAIVSTGFLGPLTGNVTGNADTATSATSATSATKATNIAGGLVGQLPYQSALDTTAMLAAGTAGQILKSNGGAAPEWIDQSAITAGNATGNAGTVTNGVYTTGDQTIGGIKTFSDSVAVTANSFSVGGTALSVASDGALILGAATGLAGVRLHSIGGDLVMQDGNLIIRETGIGNRWRLQSLPNGSGGALQIYQVYDSAGVTQNQVRLNLSDAGSLGIGAATPDQKLTVYGNISQTGMLISSGTGNSYFGGKVGVGIETVGPQLEVLSESDAAGTLGIGIRSSNNASRWGFRNDLAVGNFHLDGYNGGWAERLTILKTNGNVGIGATNPSSRLAVEGGHFTLGALSGAAAAEMRFMEGSVNGTEYIGFKAPDALAASKVFVLPPGDGTSGQILQTDGSGNLSWSANSTTGMANPMTVTGDLIYGNTTASPSTPARLAIGTDGQCLTVTGGLPVWGACTNSAAAAGTNGQLQFNNTGAFGATPALVWDNINAGLSVLGGVAGVKTSLVSRNTSGGTTATNELAMGNDIAADTLAFWVNSSAFTGAGNSAYIYNRQNAPLTLGTNNLARLTVLGNGNVGLGTTNPQYPLNIVSTDQNIAQFEAPGLAQLILQSNGGGTTEFPAYLAFNAYSPVNSGIRAMGFLGFDNSGNMIFSNTNNGFTGGIRLTIAAGGNVGISTGAPQARLDVLAAGSTHATMAQIWRDSSGVIKSSVSATGVIAAAKFVGDGSALTGVTATTLSGTLPVTSGGTGAVTLTGVLKGNGAGAMSAMTGTTGYSARWSNATTLAVGVVYDDGSKVGIGTASPGAKLEVTGGSVTIHGLISDAYVLQAGDNGIVISTGGAIQTTGLGYGTVVGNARGVGAVDLQTVRNQATNVASGNYSVIGGGYWNTASGNYSTVPGGYNNTTTAGSSTIGGGEQNSSYGYNSAIAGGYQNYIGGAANYSAIGGGYQNKVYAAKAFVGGGENNQALGDYGAISGGVGNAAGGWASVVSGGEGNRADGSSSMVPGGSFNTAKGNFSFAAGYYSSSTANGTFTWADSVGNTVLNNVADQVMFKASGGFWVSTSTLRASPGLYVSPFNTVGIGTVTSTGDITLHVNKGNSANKFLLGDDAGKGLLIRDTGSAIDIESYGAPIMFNSNTGQNVYFYQGNVGVGVTTGLTGSKMAISQTNMADPYVLKVGTGTYPTMLTVSTSGVVNVGGTLVANRFVGDGTGLLESLGLPRVRYTRTAVPYTNTTVAKDGQCLSEFGANYVAALTKDVAMGGGMAMGVNTGAQFNTAANTDSYYFNANQIAVIAGGTYSLACVQKYSPIRFTRTTILYNVSDVAKDSQCNSEFGSKYTAALTKDLAGYSASLIAGTADGVFVAAGDMTYSFQFNLTTPAGFSTTTAGQHSVACVHK